MRIDLAEVAVNIDNLIGDMWFQCIEVSTPKIGWSSTTCISTYSLTTRLSAHTAGKFTNH